MKRILKSLCITLPLLLLSGVVAHAQEADVEGSKDHPLISRYPGSRITWYDMKEFGEFDLPLGTEPSSEEYGAPPKKALHLEGKITRINYEFPEQRSPLEVYRNYEQALTRAGFTPLFSCKGDEVPGTCKGLQYYIHRMQEQGAGMEKEQRYVAAKFARPEGDAYVGVHVHNAVVLLHIIEVNPMEAGLVTVNAETLAGDITRTGHVAVYDIYFDTGKAEVKAESDPALKEIAKLLKDNPKLKLHVVGHTDNVGELAMNMNLSRRRANAIVQVLTTKHGVKPARLRAEGVGPLSPVASNKTEEGRAKNRRVELVEQ